MIPFEEFWTEIRGIYKEVGSKVGSKVLAKKQYTKKTSSIDGEKLLEIAKMQKLEKIIMRKRDNFAPNFPHVERWLKHEYYEDIPEFNKDTESTNNQGELQGDINQRRNRKQDVEAALNDIHGTEWAYR
jgi:hypothetical protein